MTVVSIRGTHGSGKSTVVTKIMAMYPRGCYPLATPMNDKGKVKVSGYRVELPTGTLRVIGPYETACGGCDAIQPYSDIWPRIETAFNDFEHVLFEGALVSSSYGNIGRALDKLAGDGAVFAFLDTPLEVCLRRIAQRREARGNFEPVKPDNTAHKHQSVERSKLQMEKLGSRIHIVDIDYTQPVKQVLKLFGVNIRKEPS